MGRGGREAKEGWGGEGETRAVNEKGEEKEGE